MSLTQKQAKQIARIRWGHRIVCKIHKGVATCNLNGEIIIGQGKTNKEAHEVVFKKINSKINELGKE